MEFLEEFLIAFFWGIIGTSGKEGCGFWIFMIIIICLVVAAIATVG